MSRIWQALLIVTLLLKRNTHTCDLVFNLKNNIFAVSSVYGRTCCNTLVFICTLTPALKNRSSVKVGRIHREQVIALSRKLYTSPLPIFKICRPGIG